MISTINIKNMKLIIKLIKLILIVFLFQFYIFLSYSYAYVERYIAVPIDRGGNILILDTKEGHVWTWNSAGVDNFSPNGSNPHIVYQGNVRNNMKKQKKNQTIQQLNSGNNETKPDRF